MSSSYAVTAAYYDAVASQECSAIHSELAGALRNLETASDPVVDIGAGTGLSTRLIANALPEAEILAVEPDPSMRAGLMARVWSDPALRRRVTILPMPVLSAQLPLAVSAMVASGSLVHFDPQERQELWALISRRLAPTGLAIVDVQCPVARDVPATRIATSQVGRITYEAWASASRVGDTCLRWRMSYVSRLDGDEIDRQDVDFVCWAISAEQVVVEVEAHGLRALRTGGLVVLSRR